MKIDQEDFNRKAQYILDTVVIPQVEKYEKTKLINMDKKNNYKVVEVDYGFYSKYVVKKRVFYFFWKTVKNNAGFDAVYDTKRGAQAYINFLK